MCRTSTGPFERVEIRPRRVCEPLDVPEPDDRRVGHVDIGVGEPVEDEGPPVRVVAIGDNRDAVVGALRVARRGRREREARTGRSRDRQRDTGRAPAAKADGQGQPDDHEHPADRHDQRSGRHQAEQHEAGQERARDRPDRPDRGQPPDGRPAPRHVGQRRADDHRRHGGQDRGRRDERDRGEDDDRHEAVAEADASDRADDRDGRDGRQATEHERRTEQRPWPERIRGQATEPCPQRDPGEDRADDPGVRRQRDADIRREQPPRGDLEHEHGGGREERQRGGDGPAEAALGARSVVHRWDGRRIAGNRPGAARWPSLRAGRPAVRRRGGAPAGRW